MIIIYSHIDNKVINNWKERLEQLFLKFEIVDQSEDAILRLVDEDKQVDGIQAIEAYLVSMSINKKN